jgi:transposase
VSLCKSQEHFADNIRRLKNGLVKYRNYVFKFLKNPVIPPYNKASERGIRKLKIKQKIRGTFRSDLNADAFMAIHSIVDTTWKNKQSPFEAILASIK